MVANDDAAPLLLLLAPKLKFDLPNSLVLFSVAFKLLLPKENPEVSAVVVVGTVAAVFDAKSILFPVVGSLGATPNAKPPKGLLSVLLVFAEEVKAPVKTLDVDSFVVDCCF